jgi:hypothetical protein
MTVRGGQLLVEVGRSIFVDDVKGDDATGARQSAVKPFKTITAALAVVQPGDTLHIAPGVYNENVALVSSIVLRGLSAPCTPIGGGPGCVQIVGDVSWAPTGAGNERATIATIDVLGSLTVDCTGKGGGSSVFRLDATRFIDPAANIQFLGRDPNLDFFHALTAGFGTATIVWDNFWAILYACTYGAVGSFALQGSLGSAVVIDAAESNMGDLTISSLSFFEARGVRNFGNVTTSGLAFFRATTIGGTLTVNGSTTSLQGCTVNGNVDITNGTVRAAQTSFAGALFNMNGSAQALLNGCTLGDLVTGGTANGFTFWSCELGAISQGASDGGTLWSCSVSGDVNIVGSMSAYDTVFLGTNMGVDPAGSLSLHGCPVFSTAIGVDGAFFADGGFINADITIGNGGSAGNCALSHTDLFGSILVYGPAANLFMKFCWHPSGRTLTANATGGAVNIRATQCVLDSTLQTVAGGSIDRDQVFIDFTGTAVGANPVAFAIPFSDNNYRVVPVESSNVGGDPARIQNRTATGFDLVDDVGGRDFELVVQRFIGS